MNWFRVYHGMPSDPKWPIISRRSGQPIGVVVSVWVALLDHASQAEDRGDVSSFDCEAYDALYGYEDGTTQAVYEALESKNMIESGRLRSWDKRQPLREDTGSETAKSSTSRVREYRARQRSETQCNAVKRQEEIREEEKRSEEIKKNTLPPTPQGDGGDTSSQNQPSDVQDSPSTYPDYEDYTFLRFYKVYPNKARKQKAYEAWIALRDKGWLPPFDDLIHSLKAQVNHYGWNLPGREVFCESLDKWLTGRRWEDECPDTPYVPPQRDTAPPQRAQASSGGFDMERQRAINAQVLADLAEEENQKRLQEKTIEN